MRALEEKAKRHEAMAKQAREGKNQSYLNRYEEEAREAKGQAQELQQLLTLRSKARSA